MHYLWPADLSKTFSQWIVSIFIFSQYFFQWLFPGRKGFLNWLCQYLSFFNIFFNRFFPVEKCWVNPNCIFPDSLISTCSKKDRQIISDIICKTLKLCQFFTSFFLSLDFSWENTEKHIKNPYFDFYYNHRN